MTPTRFDIYVRQGGRWRRLESLPGDDKEAAIHRAVSLDSAGEFDGIRAMTVVEYGSGRAPLETLAWISPELNKMASVKRQMQNQATQAGKAVAERGTLERRDTIETSPAPAPPESLVSPETERPPARRVEKVARTKKPLSEIQAAGKVIGSGILALVITAVLFVPVSALMRGLGSNIGLSGDQLQNAIFAVTGIIFVMTATVLMVRVYREYQAIAAMTPELAERPLPPASPQSKPLPRPAVVSASHAEMQSAEGVSNDAQELESEQEALADAQNDASAPDAEEKQTEATVAAGLTEQMRRTVLQFMANALHAIKDEVPRMNQHVMFGLNLFGAGAAERYGEHAGLKRLQSFILVREVIGALGNSEERVDSFCRQYETYQAEERYGMMIKAGRDIMSRNIEGDLDPFADFSEVFNTWTSDSAARAQVQGIVCIMFTDLVGSTQMTHERGDYGAQEIVRIHNAIVRSALAAHHGREVKHTGDGIMSSFTSAGNAVRAAIQVQLALEAHNRLYKELPVRVRMGLNAGEAVQEEDDFFGTTVQLAARVCDKAGEGEIFITDNVRELSKSQGIQVETAGQYTMKGVPAPMTLYRVRAAALN